MRLENAKRLNNKSENRFRNIVPKYRKSNLLEFAVA